VEHIYGYLAVQNNMTGKKTFILKTYTPQMYKWSPISSNVNKNKHTNNTKPFFCNATPNSQGQDWITTYVYNIVVNNDKQEHSAYVECDYVI